MNISLDIVLLAAGLLLSVCVFSYFLGDNHFFRLAVSLTGGALAAWFCIYLVGTVFRPFISNDLPFSKDGSIGKWIGAVLALLAAVLIFCKLYTGGKASGKAVMLILISASVAVMLLGISSGTIPAFISGLVKPFRGIEMKSIFDWAKALILPVCALIALFYTRHYKSGKAEEKVGLTHRLGEILIGFSFGAIAAAAFVASANILVRHLAALINAANTLLK